LARLCGFEPASVICEILNPDGSMARLPDLVAFGRAHGIRIGSIAELIRYRMENEPTVLRVAAGELRLKAGRFASFVYRDVVEGGVHLALVHGEIAAARPTPVRVHVHHGLLDAARAADAPPSWPLDQVLEAIAAQPCGVVVLLSYHESAEQLAARMTVKPETGRATLADAAVVDAAAAAGDSAAVAVDDSAAAHAAAIETAADSDPANLRMLGAGGQILAESRQISPATSPRSWWRGPSANCWRMASRPSASTACGCRARLRFRWHAGGWHWRATTATTR